MDNASQVKQLERNIQLLRSTISRLEDRHTRLSQSARAQVQALRRAQLRASYLGFLRWFRSPRSSFDLWPLAVLLIGPTTVGGVVFVSVHLLTGALLSAFGWGCVAAVMGATVFATLLFVPPTDRVLTRLRQAWQEIVEREQALAQIRTELQPVSDELSRQRTKLSSLESSILLRRQQLLRRPWRDLRGIDFETYLAEVCTALGASVELTKTSGDQGVDLIATFGSRRVAIQAKGYSGSVGNSAVQEVVSGQRFYSCDACAVITNSRFTTSAVQLANANGCCLISEENFDKFVMGDIQL